MDGQMARVAGVGLAALAALALVAAAVVLLTRGDSTAPVRIVAPGATPVSQSAAVEIRVQVSGAVAVPGVYSMNPDDRVMNAIAAAGGVDPNADLSGINLARRVQDEARYHVPFVGEAPPAPAPVSSAPVSSEGTAAGGGGALIDLNTASKQGLETLPGVGPALAGAIIAYREANGPFAAIEDVVNVPGIGPKTLDAIRQSVTVSAGP